MKQEYVTSDFVGAVELPEADVVQRKKMITEDELKQNLSAFDEYVQEKKGMPEFRDWWIQDWYKPAILTIYWTGLRRSEIGYRYNVPGSGLKGMNLIGDLDFIYIPKSKKNRERYIPISGYLKPHLLAYFKKRGWPGSDEYVFINHRGQPITGRSMFNLFKKMCKRAGIPETRTLHGMRHRRITSWQEDGFTLLEASRMAGHYSTNLTDRMYTHLLSKNLKEKMDRIESINEKFQNGHDSQGSRGSEPKTG